MDIYTNISNAIFDYEKRDQHNKMLLKDFQYELYHSPWNTYKINKKNSDDLIFIMLHSFNLDFLEKIKDHDYIMLEKKQRIRQISYIGQLMDDRKIYVNINCKTSSFFKKKPESFLNYLTRSI